MVIFTKGSEKTSRHEITQNLNAINDSHFQ